MTTDFPTAPSAYGLNGPSAAVTVEKSTHASHTEILTTPGNQDIEFDERNCDQPFASAFDSQIQALINSKDSRLTDNHRQILNFRYFHDYTMEEIGDVLGMTQQNVSKHHRNALAILRDALSAAMH